MTNDLIAATAAHMEQLFAGEGSGHDWAHIRRVWLMARRLAAAEPGADALVTELAALLHDIADWKFHDGDYEAGPRAARAWLLSQGAAELLIERVEMVIREVSFKGLGVATPVSSLEAALVQDADRLDAIGAIGIARAFAYVGTRAGRCTTLPYHPWRTTRLPATRKIPPLRLTTSMKSCFILKTG